MKAVYEEQALSLDRMVTVRCRAIVISLSHRHFIFTSSSSRHVFRPLKKVIQKLLFLLWQQIYDRCSKVVPISGK